MNFNKASPRNLAVKAVMYVLTGVTFLNVLGGGVAEAAAPASDNTATSQPNPWANDPSYLKQVNGIGEDQARKDYNAELTRDAALKNCAIRDANNDYRSADKAMRTATQIEKYSHKDRNKRTKEILGGFTPQELIKISQESARTQNQQARADMLGERCESNAHDRYENSVRQNEKQASSALQRLDSQFARQYKAPHSTHTASADAGSNLEQDMSKHDQAMLDACQKQELKALDGKSKVSEQCKPILKNAHDKTKGPGM